VIRGVALAYGRRGCKTQALRVSPVFLKGRLGTVSGFASIPFLCCRFSIILEDYLSMLHTLEFANLPLVEVAIKAPSSKIRTLAEARKCRAPGLGSPKSVPGNKESSQVAMASLAMRYNCPRED